MQAIFLALVLIGWSNGEPIGDPRAKRYMFTDQIPVRSTGSHRFLFIRERKNEEVLGALVLTSPCRFCAVSLWQEPLQPRIIMHVASPLHSPSDRGVDHDHDNRPCYRHAGSRDARR